MGKNPSGPGQVNSPEGVVVVDFVVEIVGGVVIEVVEETVVVLVLAVV